jgi:isopropylmalate/homocitrate/citramalate synthase
MIRLSCQMAVRLKEEEDFMNPWDIEGKWSVSRHGYADAVRATMPNLPEKVCMRDITFREGDDCVGLRISVPDKMKLVELAVEMGIKELDTGGPSMHPHQFAFSKAVKASGLDVRCTGRFFANNTKNYKRDVDINLEAGSDNLRVILMYLNEQTLLEQLNVLPAIVEYIHSCDKEVCMGMSDITRAPMELIKKVYSESIACGVDKVGIFDTFGVGAPATLKYLSETIKAMCPPDMHFMCHMHNTFGLATANSLACVEGGCDEVDGAINGYGDEAGNASQEEIAVSLEALYGIDTGLKLDRYHKYSQMAMEFGKVPIQPHKAIVGENAFLRPMYVWAGIDMAKESWMLHEPLCPELVGMVSHVVFGPEGSLDDAPIELKFKQLGIPYTAADIIKVRNAIEESLKEERVERRPRPYVTEEDYDVMVKKMFGV